MTAGEKIKVLRKEKNLTQSVLTDGLITRNMLSQIENGVANPSLSTLSALAERLSVPLEYLISESAGPKDMERLKNRENVRALYVEGKKDECAELLDKYDDDES
ncbi:MAG: helix-turn-helix transcriptional regulator, partial [Eubacteriales bacterium]|nr:helix-turn-helix transcriptional regulator [Eubacteriales bacterium]